MRTVVRLSLTVLAIGIYAAYSVLTPTTLEVSKLESPQPDTRVLQVTLHNPTYKLVTGNLHRVETLVDVTSHSGGTTNLSSLGADYPFTLLPQGSAEIDVAMNSRVVPAVDYDVILNVDGAGQQTITLKLPAG